MMLDLDQSVKDQESPFEPLGDEHELRLLRAFEEYGVRVIVVGGYAVRFHARPEYLELRGAQDLDLVVDGTPENLERVRRALNSLGIADAGGAMARLAERGLGAWRWQEGRNDHYVDVFSSTEPISFDDLAGCAVTVPWQNLTLKVMSMEHLIEAKRAALVNPHRGKEKRAKDQEDLDALLASESRRPSIGSR